jgi:hypothetical protein
MGHQRGMNEWESEQLPFLFQMVKSLAKDLIQPYESRPANLHEAAFGQEQSKGKPRL